MAAQLQRTVVLFQPECDPRQLELARKAFKEANLQITRSRRVTLNRDVVSEIVVRRPSWLVDAACAHLLGHPLLVFELEGDMAIARVREIVGQNHIPRLCASGSLRRTFDDWDGTLPERILWDGRTYNKKYIFRPKDEHEAELYISMLFNPSLPWVAT